MVVGTRNLGWISVHTRRDMIKDESIIENVAVAHTVEKTVN